MKCCKNNILLAIYLILSVLSYIFALCMFTEHYHSKYVCPFIITLLITIYLLSPIKPYALRISLLTTLFFVVFEVVYSIALSHCSYPVVGTLGNPAIYSMAVTLCIPALLYFYSISSKTIKTIILILYTLCFITVVISQSRTGIICMLISATYILWKNFHFKTKYLLCAGIAISIILVSSMLLVKGKSTAGRHFILARSVEMIKEKPFGWGKNGFSQKYMDFQAQYFKNNYNEEEALLADNMRHPLNEYMYIAINYGIHTIVIILLLTSIIVYYKFKENNNESHTFILTITLLTIWMIFSYPLSQPITWNIMYTSLLLFIHNQNLTISKTIKGLIIISASVLIFLIYRKYNYRHKWENAVELYNTKGEKYALISSSIFDKLQKIYQNDAEFLYSYATLLYNRKLYGDAINIAEKCNMISANYDLEILLANSYMYVGNLKKAEKHYIQAFYMCPNRFIPLYKLFKIHKQRGNREEMLKIGNVIVNKRIKVPSKIIDIILNNVKYEMNKVEK